MLASFLTTFFLGMIAIWVVAATYLWPWLIGVYIFLFAWAAIHDHMKRKY